jgi:hypothetical protein
MPNRWLQLLFLPIGQQNKSGLHHQAKLILKGITSKCSVLVLVQIARPAAQGHAGGCLRLIPPFTACVVVLASPKAAANNGIYAIGAAGKDARQQTGIQLHQGLELILKNNQLKNSN